MKEQLISFEVAELAKEKGLLFKTEEECKKFVEYCFSYLKK